MTIVTYVHCFSDERDAARSAGEKFGYTIFKILSAIIAAITAIFGPYNLLERKSV
jgi:hypothetical protein